MSEFIALLQFLLMLSGCDIGGSTFSNRMSIDGRDTLHSLARVHAGIARFTCKASASGRCHYILFADASAEQCRPIPRGGAAAACPPAPLREFAVPAGGSLAITGLPAFRLCVSTDGRPRDGACNSLGSSGAIASSG